MIMLPNSQILVMCCRNSIFLTIAGRKILPLAYVILFSSSLLLNVADTSHYTKPTQTFYNAEKQKILF